MHEVLQAILVSDGRAAIGPFSLSRCCRLHEASGGVRSGLQIIV